MLTANRMQVVAADGKQLVATYPSYLVGNNCGRLLSQPSTISTKSFDRTKDRSFINGHPWAINRPPVKVIKINKLEGTVLKETYDNIVQQQEGIGPMEMTYMHPFLVKSSQELRENIWNFPRFESDHDTRSGYSTPTSRRSQQNVHYGSSETFGIFPDWRSLTRRRIVPTIANRIDINSRQRSDPGCCGRISLFF